MYIIRSKKDNRHTRLFNIDGAQVPLKPGKKLELSDDQFRQVRAHFDDKGVAEAYPVEYVDENAPSEEEAGEEDTENKTEETGSDEKGTEANQTQGEGQKDEGTADSKGEEGGDSKEDAASAAKTEDEGANAKPAEGDS